MRLTLAELNDLTLQKNYGSVFVLAKNCLFLYHAVSKYENSFFLRSVRGGWRGVINLIMSTTFIFVSAFIIFTILLLLLSILLYFLDF